MKILGLTGTIASGKTSTAAIFAEAGVPVFSADAAVHQLYAGPAAPAVGAAFPGTVSDGRVDRARLAAVLRERPERLGELEAIIHPLVQAAEDSFLARAREEGHRVAVLEIPLLYENGIDRRVDKVIVTTAPEAVRRQRALARPGADPATYAVLAKRQLSDSEKRRRADFVVDTAEGPAAARRAVHAILRNVMGTG